MNLTFKAEMPKEVGQSDFSVEVKCNDQLLSEVLVIITQFLRGAGYYFDGQLTIEAPEVQDMEEKE